MLVFVVVVYLFVGFLFCLCFCFFLPCLTADLGLQPLLILWPCPFSRQKKPGSFFPFSQAETHPALYASSKLHNRMAQEPFWDIWNSKTNFSWLTFFFPLP